MANKADSNKGPSDSYSGKDAPIVRQGNTEGTRYGMNPGKKAK